MKKRVSKGRRAPMKRNAAKGRGVRSVQRRMGKGRMG